MRNKLLTYFNQTLLGKQKILGTKFMIPTNVIESILRKYNDEFIQILYQENPTYEDQINGLLYNPVKENAYKILAIIIAKELNASKLSLTPKGWNMVAEFME